MKIRILTFHAVSNYGAVLQAYALQETLRLQGHDVAFIDYRPPYLTTGGSFWFPRSRWHVDANLVIAYKKVMALKELTGGMRAQNRLFTDFIEKDLILDDRKYKNIAELRRNPPEADLYICGSDQIWNPSRQYGVDPACFLDFGESGTKKISYAASFGKPGVPQRHEKEIAGYLEKLDGISVREASGVDLVKRLSGREASLVPDPTFLIDWTKQDPLNAPAKTGDQKQIFFYVLRDGTGIYEAQQSLSQKGFHIIQPNNPHQRWPAHGEVNAMGPWDWLREISRSDAVVTNSFHGTVFSILLQKNFLAVHLSGEKSGLNERMDNVLEQTGLADRVSVDTDPNSLSDTLQRAIDWESVTSCVEKMRDAGINFLEISAESLTHES